MSIIEFGNNYDEGTANTVRSNVSSNKGTIVNKLLPLFIGLLAIVIVLLLPMNSKLFEVIFILFAIPFITYQRREKDTGDLPYQGGLQGGVIGGFAGVVIDFIVMNLISSDMAKYSIRIDLFLGGVLGASIGSTLGIIAGERNSRRIEEKE